MVVEVEEKYPLRGLPEHKVYDAVYEFNKKHDQYPAKVFLNPKYKDFGSTPFIPFPTKRPPAIEPLPIDDIEASTPKGYNVDIEYDEVIDEKTIIYRVFVS